MASYLQAGFLAPASAAPGLHMLPHAALHLRIAQCFEPFANHLLLAIWKRRHYFEDRAFFKWYGVHR